MLSNHPSVLGSGGGTAYNIIGGTGLFADGTAAAPSISFASDSDTGFWLDSSGLVRFTSNGTASFGFGGGYFTNGIGTSYLFLPNTGSISVVAAGATGNITLTPSGTGRAEISLAATTSSEFLRLSPSTNVTNDRIILSFYNPTWGEKASIRAINANSGNASGYLDIFTTSAAGAATLALRLLDTQRMLLGTTTDSGALLQIGTNTTTSAGGMVFGTDTFLSRSANGQLSLQHINGDTSLRFISTSTERGKIETFASNLYISTTTVGASLILRSGATVAALTLDSGLNATLEGNYLYLGGGTSFYFRATGSGNGLWYGNNVSADLAGSFSIRNAAGTINNFTVDSSGNATFAGNVQTAAANAFYWTGRSQIRSPADGIIQLTDSSLANFTRLQFGGTTASFPALKRSGAGLLAVVADDSAYANLYALNHMSAGAATTVGAGVIAYGGTTATTVGAAGGASLLPATPLGYIIVNVAGTAAKIPYYNS